MIAAVSTWWQSMTGSRQPLRAGMLTSGELVLVDGGGAAQVFSAQATDAIRDALDMGHDAVQVPVFPIGSET